MNNVWVGTDWHLWSVNSVTDKRHQFRSISNLGRLSDAYAEDIQSDDIFIYLGDLCDPGVTDIKKLKAIVSSIPGYKVLCKGNHDTQDDTFYKEIGFDVVCEICVIHNLVFSHKPVRVPMGYLNIHGHLHTEKMSTLGYQHINAYDSNFFERPMLVDDLIDSAAFQSPEEYAGTDLKHVEEKFEKYTSVENDTYTQIVDLTDMVGLYPVDEAVELPTFKTPEDLSKWMKSNVHYANFTKLKSSDGVAESKSGSCHDQVIFEYNALKNMGKKPKILFFIAYKEGSNQGGMTHSLVYYSEGSKVKWFENSWSGMEGIHTYDSLSDLKADIKRIYSNMPDAKNFPELEFKSVSISDFDTGMSLGEFVSGIMDEAVTDPLDEVLFSDITDVQYWENDDDAPKKKKVKQSHLDTDNQGVVAESTTTMNTFPFIFLSQENMNDELYPEGKMLLRNMDDAVRELYLYQRPAGEYYVHNTEPGYYRIIMSPEFSAGYFSTDTINLSAVGKIKVNADYSWEWIEQYGSDMNESATFSQVKRIVNNIPKEEHHWFYHGDEFKDSPYVKYRDVMYLKNGRGKTIGGFIDIYSFDSDPDTGIVVIALEPGARGTGLATKLVQKALKKLPSLGITKVIWRADVDNIASQKLAQKLGFTDISDLKANPDQYKYEYILNEMYLNSLSAAVEDTTELHEMSPKDKQAIANKYGLRTPGEYQQDGQDKAKERVNQRREKQLKDLKRARKIKKRKAFVRKVKSHLPGAQNESAMGILSMPKVVSSPPFDVDDKVDLYVGLANKKINEYGKTAKNIPVPKRKFKKNSNKNRSVPDYYLKLWFNPDRATNLLINDAAPNQHTIWLYPDEYCTLMFVCADGVCRVYMLDSYIAGDYHQFLGTFQVDMGIGARLKAALKEDSSGVDDSESDHYEVDATDRDPLWGDRNHFFKHPNAADPDIDTSIQESSVKSSILYHGSQNKYSVLKPKSKNNGRNVLFASPRYEFSLAYAGKQWNDLDINQSVVNNKLVLVEIYPDAFENIFQTSGYIYEVPDDTFQKVSSNEYISEVDVVPTKTRRVQNVLVELEKSNVQLYYYPDLPPYMPSRYEYVKARCDQYGIDFKKIQNDLYRKGANDVFAPIQENYKFELVDKNLRFVDRLDEAASNSSKSHVYTEPLYRITYNDIGIYEAYKKACSFDEWRSFINSDAATWLDVPKIYNKDINHTSYFTKRGYELFQKNTYPVIIQKLNKRNIKVDQVVLDVKPVYEDLYQVVVPNSVNESSIQDSYQFELLDKSVHFYDKIDEAASYQAKGKLYPVYVVLVHSGTGVSKAIKAISHSEYSHASICFDSSLDKMYSFARKDPRNPFIGGFRYESIGKGFYDQKEIPYAVYVVPCTESQIKKMKKRLNYFIQNQEKFTFDFTGLVTNYLGIVNNPAHRWFCSRFVADVLNAGAPKNNPYVAEPSLQDPDDFKDTDWAIYVDSGENLMKYDRKKVDRKTNQILRKEMLRRMTVNESAIFDLDALNPFIESTLNYQFAMMDEAVVDDFVRYLKSFKVKFDKEGNVIISRREVDQLDKHFRQSLRMIKAYEKAGDLDSVKLELCKINYMIELINEYYLSPKAMKSKRVKADLRKEMLDLRSVMLNAFSQHLKYVKTMDPAFNFKSYYDTSIYGKNIEIPKPVLSAIGKAIVTRL